MARARAVCAVAAVVLLLPLSAVPQESSAFAGPSGSVLPTPVAAVPRLAFTDGTAGIVETHVQNVPAGFVAVRDTSHAGYRPYEGQPSVSPVGGVGYRAFLSTRDAVSPDDPADVYVVIPGSGDDDRVVRVSCDGARKSHPVVSGSSGRVAWATETGGSWDIAVTVQPVEELGDDCAEVDTTLVTQGPADDLWPAFVPESDLIVYSSTRGDSSRLGNLWVQDVDEPEGSASQLTEGAAAETQPVVSSVQLEGEDARYVAVALTTTQFRQDGSIGILRLWDEDPSGEESFTPELGVQEVVNPYDPDFLATQGSEPAFGGPATTTFAPDVISLAYTSTRSDPAGDVIVAGIGWTDDGDAVLSGETSVIDEVGRPESHPTWATEFVETPDSGERATLLAEVGGPAPVVSDVLVDDGSDRRSTTRRSPFCGTSDGGGVPRGDAMASYAPAGDRLVHSSDTLTCELVDDEWQGRDGWALRVGELTGPTDVALDADRGPDDLDVSPTWSPDGSRIAFERYADTGEGIERSLLLVDVGAGVGGPLTEREIDLPPPDDPFLAEVGARGMSWSPDGTRLVLSRTFQSAGIGFVAVPDTFAGFTELWVVEVDAEPMTARPLVVRIPDPECTGTDCEEIDSVVQGRAPAWSPDGTEIAATSLRTAAPEGDALAVEYDGAIGIVTLADPSSNVVDALRPVTGFAADGTALPSRPLVSGADEAAWSPDGSQLAFTAIPAGRAHELGIWVIAPDGTGARPLADRPGPESEAVFQPWTDLVLTMSATVPVAGGPTRVVATATNAGPGRVEVGTVDLALPSGVTVTAAPGCTVAAAQVTCPLSGPLLPGASVDVSVETTAETAGEPFLGVATTTTPERVVTNNSAHARVGVAGGVSVTVGVDRSPIFVGGVPATATFTVRNVGTLPALEVRLSTSYPPGVVPSGADPCTLAAGVCILGTLAGGEARVLTATLAGGPAFVGPPQVGQVTGAVATTSPDPQPADDAASALLEVRSPQLAVFPAVARPGEVVFVDGRWFPPSGPVRLAWSQGVMGAPGPYPTDDAGAFEASVLVLRDNLVLPRELLADPVLTPVTFGQVRQPVLIVPTAVDAPSFLFRK